MEWFRWSTEVPYSFIIIINIMYYYYVQKLYNLIQQKANNRKQLDESYKNGPIKWPANFTQIA
jgi:hypothetical protein